MSDIDVSFQFGVKNIHFKIEEDSYHKFKTLCTDQNVTVKEILSAFIIQRIAKFDGGSKLDDFFDPEFFPKPNIDDDVEHKIIPWLRRMSTEDLSKQSQICYQSYVWARALHSTPPSERLLVNFDLTTLWKRFR